MTVKRSVNTAGRGCSASPTESVRGRAPKCGAGAEICLKERIERENRMKRFFWPVVVLCFLAGPAHAADDVLTRATKLLEKRHYDEAAAVLRPAIGTVEQAKQGVAYLTLGTAYFRSRFVDLYLGEALLDGGKAEAAVSPLEKFISDESIEPKYREIAKAMLGAATLQRGDKQKADELWKGTDGSDPEVKTELAAEIGRAGLTDREPVALCDEGLAALKKAGKPLPLRAIKNALAVYVKAGLEDKGLDLIKRAELKAASYSERMSKTKEINFYDMSLLSDLAGLYLQAGIAALENASRDPQLKDTANYYLGEAYALSGKIDL